uniref:Peptidase S28 n=1 Tax=Rhabditophanes sp. KR3021 TaxID=114890 RepID=A0AC35UE45_9BILA
MVGGRPANGFKPIPKDYKPLNLDEDTHVFDNRIDHFNDFNKNTFEQNYWFNSDNYKPGGPSFLMLGGESRQNNFWTAVPDLEWAKLASQQNAIMFNLEHRYYGESNPTPDMSTANLKYLSSRQALADAAAFIKAMNTDSRFNLTDNVKWVTFGGSYSGSLAVWMRELYPELVYAAVGSSAPVNAVVDFYQYLDGIQATLTSYNPLCASDLSAGLAQSKFTQMVGGRPANGFKPIPKDYKPLNLDEDTQVFDNRIDHFNDFNKNTFEQNYWFNSDNYKPGGPSFLMLGGESRQNNFWTVVPDLEWAKLASQQNAIMFNLEHRYYGESNPTPDMSTANLRYLSSRQALADAAAFIKAMNTDSRFNLTDNVKWVTFGGSYSGSLAVWMRELYPELVYAAVGSSAPVNAVVDFYQYLDGIQATLTSYNRLCASDLSAGLAQVSELVKTSDGQKQINKAFNLCDDWSTYSPDDITYFWQNTIGVYSQIIQTSGINNGEFRNVQSVENACAFHLRKSSTPLKNLQDVVFWFRTLQFDGGSCVYNNYTDYIQNLQQTVLDEDVSDARAWLYQCCTEFGFFQSTDADATKFWGNVMDVNFNTQQCAQIFGPTITNASIYNNVKKTNTHYGGASKFRGTRVITPNGSWDPWNTLGLLTPSKNNQVVPVPMTGTCHCEDMYMSGESDPQSLVDGRNLIATTLNEWLNPA